MKNSIRKFSAILTVAIMFFVTAPVSSQQFNDSGQLLPGLYAGSAHWGYYDAGSTPDLVLTGLSASGNPTTLVLMNSAGTLTEVATTITGVYHGIALWGDYDNDGDADIFVSGMDDEDKSIAEIWRNNNGVFAIDSDQSLTGLRYSSAAWGDFNGDGLLDLITTGMDRFGDPQTILYKNRKAEGINRFLLESETAQSFLNVAKGDVLFGDFDQDGDLDLVLTGLDAGGFPNSAVYVNDPTGQFAYDNKNSPLLAKLSNSSLAWADYDNDGSIDLVMSGLNAQWQSVTVIYENHHNGSLGDYNLASVQEVAGELAVGDFDNDGDPDIAISGKDEYTNLYGNILNRQSNNQYTEVQNVFASLRDGALATGDYDLDGKLDLLVSGVNNSGQYQTQLYRNTTVSSNAIPQAPASLHTVKVTNDQVHFSWDSGTDAITSTELLTYNLRVGIAGSPDKIMSGNIPVGSGDIGSDLNSILHTQLAEGEYTWSVQTINAQYGKSAWSSEETFRVEQFVSSLQNIAGFQFAATAWGDYDNDGDQDLVVSGTDANSNNRSILYKNDDGILVEDLANKGNMIKINYGDFAWGDIDNDGDLDLAYTGFFVRESPTSGIYINNNSILTEQSNLFIEVGFASLDWGDYDRDGDVDLVVMGKTDAGPFVTKIYNNVNGTLEESNIEIMGYANGQLKWVDIDLNGWLDLAITGQSVNSDNLIRLYSNLDGVFTEYDNTTFPSLQSSSMEWADLNVDGILDMVVSGFNSSNTVETAVFLANYDFTDEILLGYIEDEVYSDGLIGALGGSMSVGDYDNDGDPDLVISGYDLSEPVLKVYKNSQNTFIEEELSILDKRGVYFSSVDFIDIDSDGDLELSSLGLTTTDGVNFTAASNVYDNVNSRTNPNTPPSFPLGMDAVVSGGNVILSWNAAVDQPIGDPLRLFPVYQVRVGTTSRGNEVMSGAVQVELTNYGTSLSRQLGSLTSGDYYWSIRAIDNGLAASDWSDEHVFRVDTDAPLVTVSSVSIASDTVGIGTVTIVIAIDENFDLNLLEIPVVTASFDGGITQQAVDMISYSGLTWIGELDVAESYTSGSVSLSMSGVTDAVGNLMMPVTLSGLLYVDTDRPIISATTPEFDQTGVQTNVTLMANFSEVIDGISVDNSVLELFKGSASVAPASDVQLSSDKLSITRLYSNLDGEALYTAVIVAKIKDRAGNTMETFYSWSFVTARIVSAANGGTVTSSGGAVTVYFPPTSLPGDVEIPIEPITPVNLPDGATFTDIAYRVGLVGSTISLLKPASLMLTYSDTEIFMKSASTQVLDENSLVIYNQAIEGSTWDRLGGTIDPLANTVTVPVAALGTFGLFTDSGSGSGEALSNITFSPRVFGPGGSGHLPKQTSINFELGASSPVTILVFNSSGRVVRRLMDSQTLNTGRQAVIWNGMDGSNRVSPSGLYTVVITAGGKKEIKTVAISNK